jgi:hypothetical protein
MTYAYRLTCGCIGLGDRGLTVLADTLPCHIHRRRYPVAGFGIAWARLVPELPG